MVLSSMSHPVHVYTQTFGSLSTTVRTESCSDDEEETYTNLENEFGNMLEKVLKPWSAVTMGEEIGNGSFGKVYHGYLDVGEFTRVEVAIKESSNSNDRTDLIHEGKNF